MIRFRYVALDAGGARRRGALAAASEAAAAEALRAAGWTPVSLRAGARAALSRRAPADETAAAMRRLAALAAARAPLDRALLLAGGSGPRAGALFADLALAIASGRPLSAALADWPADFDRPAIAIIASGERSGDLPRALDAVAAMLERRAAGRRDAVSALAYPVFVLVAALLAGAVFVGFAAPSFEQAIAASGAPPSSATSALFSGARALRDYGPFALLALAAAGLAALIAGGTPGGRRALAGLAARAPLIGPLLRDRALETYCDALAAMLAGGAPLAEGAALAAEAIAPPRLAAAARAAAGAIPEGRRFSDALRADGALPDTLAAFVEIGEETGDLAALTDRAARHFGAEAEARARRLSAVAGPAITLALGLLIGVGAYLMMTAVLDVYDAAL